MVDRATEDPSEFCFVLPEMSVARVSSMKRCLRKMASSWEVLFCAFLTGHFETRTVDCFRLLNPTAVRSSKLGFCYPL